MSPGNLMWAAVCGLLLYVLYCASGRIDDLTSTLAQAQSDLAQEQARTASLKRNVVRLEAKNATSRKALREALDANAPWAGSPVPDAVADGLCNTPGVRCAARTVRAPGD